MKKSILLVGIFFTMMAVAQGNTGVTEVPIEVTRGLTKAYQNMDSSQRTTQIKMHEKAYVDMMNYVNNSEIPTEEKEGILRNVNSMYPNNYVMQKAEAIDRVDHVKSLM